MEALERVREKALARLMTPPPPAAAVLYRPQAIQAAINFVTSNASARALLFPAGTYAVGTMIVIPNGGKSPTGPAAVRMLGEGQRVSIIRAVAPMLAVVLFESMPETNPVGKPQVAGTVRRCLMHKQPPKQPASPM